MAELALHTFPAHSNLYSYEPVAGVSIPGRDTVWDKDMGEAQESPQTVVKTFEVPELLATRIADFLNYYNTSRWASSAPAGGRPSFSFPLPNLNCHSFASMVTDKNPLPDGQHAGWRARKIVASGVIAEPPLQAGQQGVIAELDETKRWRFRAAQPLHSIIGLGPEYTDCLQMTNLAGWVALSSYEDVLSGYCVGQPGSNNRLYVRET